MEWLNILIQGSLLGGIYALFAIGLSLSFGIMRLVNIAHGDLIVLSAYVALVVGAGHRARSDLQPRHRRAGDVRARLRAAARAVESDAERRAAAAAARHLRHFGHHPERAAAGFRRLHPSPAGGRDRDREPATARRHHRSASIRCWSSRVAVLAHRQPAASVLPHRPRPRLSRGLRRCRHRRADGHRQPQALRAGARHRDDLHRDRRRAVRHPHQSSIRRPGRSG